MQLNVPKFTNLAHECLKQESINQVGIYLVYLLVCLSVLLSNDGYAHKLTNLAYECLKQGSINQVGIIFSVSVVCLSVLLYVMLIYVRSYTKNIV